MKDDKNKDVASFIISQAKLNDNIALQDRGKLVISDDIIDSSSLNQQINGRNSVDVYHNDDSKHLQKITASILETRREEEQRALFSKEQKNQIATGPIKGENGMKQDPNDFSSSTNTTSGSKRSLSSLSPLPGHDSDALQSTMESGNKSIKKPFLHSDLQNLLSELPSATNTHQSINQSNLTSSYTHTQQPSNDLKSLLSALPSVSQSTPTNQFDLASQLGSFPQPKGSTISTERTVTPVPSFVFNLAPSQRTQQQPQQPQSQQQQSTQSSTLQQFQSNLASLQIDAHLKDKILAYYNSSISNNQQSNHQQSGQFSNFGQFTSVQNLSKLGLSVKPIIPSNVTQIGKISSKVVPTTTQKVNSPTETTPTDPLSLPQSSQQQIQALIHQELTQMLTGQKNPQTTQLLQNFTTSPNFQSPNIPSNYTQIASKLIKQELNQMSKNIPIDQIHFESDFNPPSPDQSTNNMSDDKNSTNNNINSNQLPDFYHFPRIYFNPITQSFTTIPIEQILPEKFDQEQLAKAQLSCPKQYTTSELQAILRQEALKLKIWLQQLVFEAGQTNDPNILARGDKKGSVLAKLEKRAKTEFKGYLAKGAQNTSELQQKHDKYVDLLHQYQFMSQLLMDEEKVIEKRAESLTTFFNQVNKEQLELQQLFLKRSRE